MLFVVFVGHVTSSKADRSIFCVFVLFVFVFVFVFVFLCTKCGPLQHMPHQKTQTNSFSLHAANFEENASACFFFCFLPFSSPHQPLTLFSSYFPIASIDSHTFPRTTQTDSKDFPNQCSSSSPSLKICCQSRVTFPLSKCGGQTPP